MRRTLVILLVATIAHGCNSDLPGDGKVSLDQLGQSPAGETRIMVTGTVLEALPAGQYIYLRLKTSEGEAWAAVDAAPVATGQQVTVASQMLMRAFESTALKRTFDAVHFGALVPDAAGMATAANPHAGGMQAAAPANNVKVEKATGPDARTVEEAWTRKASLEGKTVIIHGMVVKVTEGVMGKNWLHLQDGTGNAASGTNDITVVTADRATMGETVTIKGTLRTDRDIGAGYRFAVIVEDAKVAR